MLSREARLGQEHEILCGLLCWWSDASWLVMDCPTMEQALGWDGMGWDGIEEQWLSIPTNHNNDH
jgi:hypothetical protein